MTRLEERYFERRTLDAKLLDLDHAVRWHAGIRAIVALMTNPVSAEPIGIHRTFLDAGGAKKTGKGKVMTDDSGGTVKVTSVEVE